MVGFPRHKYFAQIEKENKNNIVYEYVMAQLMVAYDDTRRSKKGAMARIEKLGNKLVEQGLLTQEQADELLKY